MAASGTTKKVTLNQLLGAGGTATLASATITGDLTVDTSTLKVDSANNRVGIGTASPAKRLEINQSANAFTTIGTGEVLRLIGDDGNVNSRITEIGFGSGPTGATYPVVVLGAANTSVSGFGTKDLYFATRAGISDVAPLERYRIASDGVATWSNVGGVAGTAMTLNSTGLGVGVTPSGYRLHVRAAFASTVGGALIESGEFNQKGLVVNCTSASLSANNVEFQREGTARLTLDASGNLLVGKTAAATGTNGFQVAQVGAVLSTRSGTDNTTSTMEVYSSGASNYRFYVGMAGTVFATNTTISAISDARLKENVQDLDVGLGAILALKPRKFDWKAGKGKDIKGDRGFIAQEFEQVFPNLIDEWKDAAPEGEAPYKSVRQDLIPVLVKAIQELAAEVNALKNA
jgi:hypothetical protein